MVAVAFEDIALAPPLEYGAWEVTRDQIVAFARDFDPQPFHLDEAAGRASLLGGLAASGWHSAAILMRLTCDGWLNAAAGLGGPGIETLNWLRPVRPGDILRARREVLDARPLRSQPGAGLVRFDFALINQRDETVMTQRCPILFARRGMAKPPPGAFDRPPSGAPLALPPPQDPAAFPLSFDDMTPGPTWTLGRWRVGRDEAIAFARSFDPQPFHIEESAAAASPFGRLSASGWHTAARWMRAMIDARQRAAAAREAAGRPVPPSGPSPGFRDLVWLRPVYAGDELTYWTRTLERRPTRRPGWGLAVHRNGAVNQHGDPVFEFTSSVFTPA